MGKLIYSVLTSLDGYVADAGGTFDWAAPGREVHQFVNDLQRSIGTYLFGRRLYEVMAVWEDMPGPDEYETVIKEFADIWRSAEKVVYSTTLTSVSTANTRLEQQFDAVNVRAMTTQLERDVAVGGPTLASAALRASIVDEVHLIVSPVVVGGGTRCWPDGIPMAFDLVDQRRFADGTVHLHYSVR